MLKWGALCETTNEMGYEYNLGNKYTVVPDSAGPLRV